jgi:hypothetical protein
MNSYQRKVVENLRFRWPKELASLSDDKLFILYEDFLVSADYGNNDEKFPEWFKDAI